MNSTGILSTAWQGTAGEAGGGAIDAAALGALSGVTLIVLAGLGALVLIVAALAQIVRAVHLSEPARTRWVLTVVFAPVFGALAWFAVGNRLQVR